LCRSGVIDMEYRYWFDWERCSSRQSAYMKLCGLIGKLTYGGDLSEFISYLRMGQILHVGGKYRFCSWSLYPGIGLKFDKL
jgi:hypothetical protein